MVIDKSIVSLSSEIAPEISAVGGKAASLIRLSQAGFNVPDGFVLKVDFFRQWNQQLSASPQWQEMLNTAPTKLRQFTECCDRLKACAATLEFSAEQIHSIQRGTDSTKIYAVRSSSPEEDLAESSFAGLYATVLGVRVEKLADAVRACYLSCLDARVLVYKHKLHIAFDTPRIAVVIQEQIQSEVAGVVFSLNPLNNDFDEALINASFGLGEALVSGAITPDSWTVNKISHEVIHFSLGTKGGDRSDTACLDSEQIRLLSHTASLIEAHYQQPMDIEWALVQDQLFLLQARPITTFIPITPSMMTKPGAPRILYMDESLADGITISGPVSTITIDYILYILSLVFQYWDRRLNLHQPSQRNLIFSTDVRIYMNISQLMRWRKKLTAMATAKRILDTTYADILEICDLKPYQIKAASLLEKLKAVPLICKMLWSLKSIIGSTVKAIFQTEKFQQRYTEKLAAYDNFIKAEIPPQLPIDKFLLHYFLPFAQVTQATSAPALGLYVFRGTGALNKLIDARSERQQQLVEAIKSGSGDMIMVMGHKIYELSILLEASAFDDLPSLAKQITDRTVKAEFLLCWDQFMSRFGCRGPLEMDLSQPKYADDPLVLLRQIAGIVRGKQKFDPRLNYKLLQENRHKSYLELMQLLPRKQQKKLVKAYQNMCAFEHAREIPKDHIVTIQKRFREYLLKQAASWVAQDRLDSMQQIFDLKVAEILAAQRQHSFDLREVLARRDPYVARARRVRHFPHAIDSRGRILRPPSKHTPGQLVGTPVSSGVVIGPVKIMHDPFEKELLQGEILVAYSTDPGWTPLFINAAAVLLEVGGELQHGALVAREYGKPCVAGIVNVTRELQDGQMVEVNGNSGHVRILEEAADE